jgi:hypothetical protein
LHGWSERESRVLPRLRKLMGACRKSPRVDSIFVKKLLEHPGSEAALKKLDAGSVKREFVVPLLHVMVNRPAGRRDRILPNSKDLKRVAARIQRTGEEIADYNAHSILAPKSAIYDPSQKALFEALPLALASYSDHLQFCARRLAELGKTKPRGKKLLTLNLLDYVWRQTGDYHYHEIALLITAAEAAQGSTKTIEPSALKMQMERNAPWTVSGFSAASKSPPPEAPKRKHLTFGDRIAGKD